MAAKTTTKPQLTLDDPMGLIGSIQLGGRQLQPVNPSFAPTPGFTFIPRRTQNQQLTDLLGYGAYDVILDRLPDLSPDVSLALWNMIRLVSRGMKVEARKLDDSSEDDEAQQAASAIVKSINAAQGGIEGMIQTLIYSLYVYGDAALEVLPSVDGRGNITGVEDWFTASTPSLFASRDTMNFQRVVWYQRHIDISAGLQATRPALQPLVSGTPGYTRLNPNLFFYFGLDTSPDYPYGRSPIQPVLSHILTDIQLLQDLGAWVHVGVWPHMMASIDMEQLKAISPPAITQDPLKWRQWISDTVNDARQNLSNRNPDDTIALPSFIKLEAIKSGGAEGASAAKEVVMMVERKIIRALKMLPALMGSNEGATETHSTVQWEVFSATIEALQKGLAYILEQAVTVSLRLVGKAALVNVAFEQVRASDRYRDAQSQLMEDQHHITARNEGWETQDEASIAITGTPAVPEDERYADPTTPKLQGVAAATNVEVGDANQPGLPTANENAQAQPGDNQADNPTTKDSLPRSRAAGYRAADLKKPIVGMAHKAIAGYLSQQASRVMADVAAGADYNPDDLIDEGDDGDLAYLLTDIYAEAGNTAYKHAAATLGMTLAFKPTADNVKQYLDTIPARAKGINDTQRDGVKRALADVTGVAAAQAIKAYYDSSLGPDASRIASTEAQYAYNNAALSAFDDAGVGMVDIYDGDYDQICADRDGAFVTIDVARDMVANTHPNCQISVSVHLADGTVDDSNGLVDD